MRSDPCPAARPPRGTDWYCIALRPTALAVRQASAWIRCVASRLRLPATDSDRIELVLTELIQNVVDHARFPAPHACLEVSAWIDAVELHLEVVDAGGAFDPLGADPPAKAQRIESLVPGGLGLVLVREFADQLRYRRRDGRNHVIASFILGPDGGLGSS